MTTATAHPTTAAKRNLPRLYLLETKYEFLKLWRLRAYSLSTLVFPVMFYLIFGSSFGGFSTQGIRVAAYLMASYAAVGVINAARVRLRRRRRRRARPGMDDAQARLAHARAAPPSPPRP